jgi:predicted amidophosphoribosyltransferase
MKPTQSKAAGLLKTVKRYPGVDTVYHVAYYHAARVGYQDVISRSVHDFKDGSEPQLTRWISLAAPLVCKELQFDLIIRALGSAEENATGTAPLDKLCNAIAECSGADYTPERLRKSSPVRALTTLGGRVMRQKELDGVYEFDGKGLPESLRILMVDDLATTGATMEAVTKAIRSSHAGAEILHFVLARVEGQTPNSHLDSAYFLGGNSSDTRRKSGPLTLSAPSPSIPSHRGKVVERARRDSSVSRQISQADLERGRAGNGGGDGEKRGIDTKVYVIGLLASLVLLGTTVLIPMKKRESSTTQQFAQLVSQNEVKSPDPIPERREPVVEPFPAPGARAGVILVPSTGLRIYHSMDARRVARSFVRRRERVEILHRFSARTGPDWIQLRTRSGEVGWVVASVVREVQN